MLVAPATAAQVQALPLPSVQLPQALPAPVSDAASGTTAAASVQALLPQLLPGRQPAHGTQDEKQVSPASDPHNVDSPGQASDDRLVH